MMHRFTDYGSNTPENQQHWAEVLGTGLRKRKVFNTVYSGKKTTWTGVEISAATGLSEKVVADVGKPMVVGGLIEQLPGSRVVYRKIPEVHQSKALIVRMADNKRLRVSLTTKRNPQMKGRVKNVTNNTTNFSNVGVANTGSVGGSITGSSAHTQINEGAAELFAALKIFKNDISTVPGLSAEVREDAIHAVSELEAEAQKPKESRIASRVRNAASVLKSLGAGTDAVKSLYEQVHPFITSHFHVLS